MKVQCEECSRVIDTAAKTDTIELWWCRDCVANVCKQCHLIKGHSEHRSNEWKNEEILRCAVQAIEGRCSRRSEGIHQQKLAVKEFVAKVEVLLLNQLSTTLERQNEPDRRLISRINRELSNIEMKENKPSIYHVPSPSRPAWKSWNLFNVDPPRMRNVLEMTGDILQLPRQTEYDDDELILKTSSEWDAQAAANVIATSMGIPTNQFYSNMSRCSTPATMNNNRRRGNSVDSHLHTDSAFSREKQSMTSFRERATPLEENNFGTHSMSQFSLNSRPSTAISSLPAYPNSVSSLGSQTSSTSQAVTPTPQMNEDPESKASEACRNAVNSKFQAFGKSFLTRPICVQTFKTATSGERVAITDSCGGVYITNDKGEIAEHILIKNSSASSVAVDEKNEVLYVSIMQSKGRSIHVFDIADGYKKIDVIACPKEPKIEMSRTRWITVGPRGHLFMTSGDNVKSALWTYIRSKKAWKTLKESRKSRYQYLCVAEDQAEYKAVVLLTCDAANNRLLLFVVDHTMSLINEYDLSKTYRLTDHIQSPASAIVDKFGNLIILDYATGKIWILLSGVKGIRRLKQVQTSFPMKPQEALGICCKDDDIIIALFNRREVRYFRYLDQGTFRPFVNGSPLLNNRRSSSLPRTEERNL